MELPKIVTKFNLLVTHAQCNDGFGAWCIARKCFPDAASFMAFHGGKIPNYGPETEMLVTDFGWAPEIIFDMAGTCKSFVLLDHHLSTMEATYAHLKEKIPPPYRFEYEAGKYLHIELRDNRHIIFDMARSGVTLAWDYCFPGSSRPNLVQYLEDWDLWKKNLLGTDECNAFLSTMPRNPELWDIATNLTQEIKVTEKNGDQITYFMPLIQAQDWFKKGQAVLEYKDGLIKNALKMSAWVGLPLAGVDPVKAEVIRKVIPGHVKTLCDGREVVVCRGSNMLPEMASETGEALALAYDGIGLTWIQGAINTTYSIRSRNVLGYVPDISVVSSAFGGGGHAAAAGFKSSTGAIHFFITPENMPVAVENTDDDDIPL